MQSSAKGRALIKEFEGFRSHSYPDPASPLFRATKKWKLKWGYQSASQIFASLPPEKAEQVKTLRGNPWTIGYGFTSGVQPNMVMSEGEADVRLAAELVQYEQGVLQALSVPPNQNEFDACVSLAWNIGVSRFQSSSVVKAHNRGDKASASRAFGLWNKANGQEEPGLVRRRAKESQVYLLPAPSDFAQTEAPPAMPQSVDDERPMTASNINRASVVAGGTAAVTAATEVINTVNGFKYGLESLGSWVVPVVLVSVVALCGYIIYERYQQRKNGWA